MGDLEMPLTLDVVENILFWCMVINVSMLFISFLLMVVLKPLTVKMHNRIFDVSEEYVSKSMYAFLGAYKLLTFFFVIIPWIAIKIIQS